MLRNQVIKEIIMLPTNQNVLDSVLHGNNNGKKWPKQNKTTSCVILIHSKTISCFNNYSRYM